jgi:putative endonuclease
MRPNPPTANVAAASHDESSAARAPAFCYVYVLGHRSMNGSRTYVGWTTDLDRRLEQHNAGTGARSTRGRAWSLLYAERYEDRPAAMAREWRLKRDRRLRRELAGLMPGE